MTNMDIQFITNWVTEAWREMSDIAYKASVGARYVEHHVDNGPTKARYRNAADESMRDSLAYRRAAHDLSQIGLRVH